MSSTTNTILAAKRLLLPKELRTAKGIPYHINHLRRMWRRGEFPRPVQLSPHRIGFVEHEVDAWIENRPQVTASRGRG